MKEAPMRPAHTIQLVPWRGTSTGERIALEMTSMALWPLQDNARMTVLINLMASQVDRMCEDEDQVDALIDVLRMQLRMMRPAA
jgi:hypothetical protein